MMMDVLKWLDLRRLGFAAVFLSFLTLINLTDPDYFWHLRTGQYLLEQGALPTGDVFSYTNAGQPWILHEWLFEVMLASIHALLGEFGVKLMTSLLATATLVIAYATANKILGKPYVAFFLALAFFIPAALSISPRPQMLTFLLFVLFLRVLTGFKSHGENRGLLALPPLMAVWVNFHGGYVAGLALLALFTACEWLVFLATDSRDEAQRRRLQWLSLAAVAALLSSLANPYFLGHWLYPFQVMGMEASRHYISEWLRPAFQALGYQVYLGLVFTFFITAIYRKTRTDFTELAVPLFFVTAGFVTARHIPLAVIAMIPFAAATFAQQPLARMIPTHWLQACTAWYGRRVRQGRDLGDTEYLLNWLLLVVVIGGFLLYYPIYHAKDAEKVDSRIPVKATEFLIKEGIRGRMFNTYHYGGYLIQQLYPAQKVFIDGRADMYGDAFLKEYIEISSGGSGWEKLFDKHQIDYVLIQHDSPLRQLLLIRGDFKLVYDDETNSVLLKDREEYAPIIAKYSR